MSNTSSERQILGWDFEAGGYVRVYTYLVDTEKALDKLQDLISMKRRELWALRSPNNTVEPPPTPEEEADPADEAPF